MEKSVPGLKQSLLKDEPVVDNLLLRSLGQLRTQATSEGFQSIAITALDYRMSHEGAWSREFVQSQGYSIGKRAWRPMKLEGAQASASRRKWEASKKGGAPSKITKDVLEVTKQILDCNSKPGSKVAHVHQHASGARSSAKRRGSRENEVMVESQSLLKTPARMWEENPQLRTKMRRSKFYEVLKNHFAEYRPGQRRTDVCTHCETYWQKLIPRFRKAWNEVREKLTAVYPGYFKHFDTERVHETACEEANHALAYVSSHSAQHRAERMACGCNLLQLYSFTEAPPEVLLRGHRDLLRSYEWHMTSANRQKQNFDRLVEKGELPVKDCLLCFDWKEKIRLPVGPSESSDYWHMQQRYAIAVYGCVVYRHEPSSTARAPKIRHDYYINLTDIREQTAEAANNMLDSILSGARLGTEGCLHLFYDCGPHYRSGPNVHHYLQLSQARKQQIFVHFFGEQHGKNILDGAFGTIATWLRQVSLAEEVLNLSQLVCALQKGASGAMKSNPQGPRWFFKAIDYGEFKKNEQATVTSSDFKITKTYALAIKPGRNNPLLYNLVYSDCAMQNPSCFYNIVTERTETLERWKRAYMEGPRSWELEPPDPGDETILCKKFKAQKHKESRLFKPVKTFHDKAMARARKAAKDKVRVRLEQRLQTLKGEECEHETSSSSSSSSSSSVSSS